VRVLLVTSRSPWPPHSGDRLRALLWMEALRHHAVTLVAPPADDAAGAAAGAAEGGQGVTRVEVRRSLPALAAGAFAVARRGLPAHTLLAARAWRRAIARAAASDGPFDVAIVLLSRLVPWLPELPARRTILDSIDSAAVGMAERARAARGPARLFWRRERRAAERLEAAAARRYDAVVAVTREESARFGDKGVTLPVGIPLPPLAAAGRRGGQGGGQSGGRDGGRDEIDRDVDFAFWGRLPYFANRRAARLLLDRLWPRIRARRPGATLLVGGAEAPRWLRARDGRDGVRVASPIGDRDALLAGVRVALLPIEYGSGQSLKTLEAAASGCAIAGTTLAFRGCEHLMSAAVVEDDPDRLADRAVELIESGRDGTAGRALRDLVERHDSRPALLARMARLVEEGR
jgi:polysaccharide biosynthesis protein PslH